MPFHTRQISKKGFYRAYPHGLSALTSVTGDLYIWYNAMLPQCLVDAWLLGVNVGGTVTTSNNATCN